LLELNKHTLIARTDLNMPTSMLKIITLLFWLTTTVIWCQWLTQILWNSDKKYRIQAG